MLKRRRRATFKTDWRRKKTDPHPAPAPNQNMEPHQQRVVDEKTELDDKREKLSAFKASNPLYVKLPEDEQHRLSRQLAVMTEYSEILGERIGAFPA